MIIIHIHKEHLLALNYYSRSYDNGQYVFLLKIYFDRLDEETQAKYKIIDRVPSLSAAEKKYPKSYNVSAWKDHMSIAREELDRREFLIAE